MFADEEDGAGSAVPACVPLVSSGEGASPDSLQGTCVRPVFSGRNFSGKEAPEAVRKAVSASVPPRRRPFLQGTVLPRFSGDRTSGKGSSPRFFRSADVSWLGALRTVTVGCSAEDAVRSRRSRFLFAAGLFRRLPERNLFEAGVGSSGGVRCFVGSPGGVVSE